MSAAIKGLIDFQCLFKTIIIVIYNNVIDIYLYFNSAAESASAEKLPFPGSSASQLQLIANQTFNSTLSPPLPATTTLSSDSDPEIYEPVVREEECPSK